MAERKRLIVLVLIMTAVSLIVGGIAVSVLYDSAIKEQNTDLFRGIDCANPSVDFEGCLIIGTADAVKKCGMDPSDYIEIIGCHVEQACEDSIEDTPKIVPYEHLRLAFDKTCEQAEVDFRAAFLAEQALLEVYTCYPVVPIAFLLKTGFVQSAKAIPNFLKKYPVTVTGGLNLAKAPANNASLQALVTMVNRMEEPEAPQK